MIEHNEETILLSSLSDQLCSSQASDLLAEHSFNL